jgi:hypothetical protein
MNPTQTIYDVQVEYEPSGVMTSLDWYNVANCARQRMSEASKHLNDGDPERGFLLWRRERITFWTLLRTAIPYPFL